MENCLFCKIANKEIPSSVVYEDDKILAFNDINPVAPVHILVIPKKHIAGADAIEAEDAEILGYIWTKIRVIAEKAGVAEKGFRVINNCGEDGGQTVRHLHFHIIGGVKLTEKMI
ncbi:MAG: histidine triad nucleotide-binding protein [Clostridia bacterium]|nr:histidine triad nucleotide-binding protein [Clostridia bacterium]